MKEESQAAHLSAEQKEVWGDVANYTRMIINNDTKEFLKYYHRDYIGLNYKVFLPIKKSDIKNELLHLPKRKINSYEIIPIAINIVNNVAIVHYSYSVVFKTVNGDLIEKSGLNTDILTKKNKKWLIIADHVRNNKVLESND